MGAKSHPPWRIPPFHVAIVHQQRASCPLEKTAVVGSPAVGGLRWAPPMKILWCWLELAELFTEGLSLGFCFSLLFDKTKSVKETWFSPHIMFLTPVRVVYLYITSSQIARNNRSSAEQIPGYWQTPIFPALWEAETKRLKIQAQPRQVSNIVRLCLKILKTLKRKRTGHVAPCKSPGLNLQCSQHTHTCTQERWQVVSRQQMVTVLLYLEHQPTETLTLNVIACLFLSFLVVT